MRKLTGDHNQCPTCLEYFNSTKAFDAHRTGPYSNRRCLTVQEMLEKGMGKNKTDWWVTELRKHPISSSGYSQNANATDPQATYLSPSQK